MTEKISPAMTRLTQCMTNLQDPAVVNRNGERDITFDPADDYHRYPGHVVAQSGGTYTTNKQFLADLRKVGGEVERNGYTMRLVPHGVFGRGGPEINFQGPDRERR